MKLGIMVISDVHLDQIRGITQAALHKGCLVEIFATGEGTKLLADREFSSLSAWPGVAMSYCALSAQRSGGRPAGLPEAIVSGSQFDNAIMVAESDKVITL